MKTGYGAMSSNSKNGIWTIAVIGALAVAVSWTVQGSGIGPAVHQDEEGGTSISKVHGSINVPDGGRAGALKTVNGSITVGDGAEVGRIKVVNGSVRIGENSRIQEAVSSVNGSIRLDSGSHAASDVSTVNGRIHQEHDSVVDGEVSTVNGRMELRGAEAGSLTTTNGDIELQAGSVVRGDLTVRKPDQKGWSLFGRDRPRVVIGDNCEVRGELHFEQEVELVVAESASIGAITGVEPVRD